MDNLKEERTVPDDQHTAALDPSTLPERRGLAIRSRSGQPGSSRPNNEEGFHHVDVQRINSGIRDRPQRARRPFLDKAEAYAEAKRIDPTVVPTRLFPDMFAFTRQVQSACDQAKNAAHGSPASSHRGMRTTRSTIAGSVDAHCQDGRFR